MPDNIEHFAAEAKRFREWMLSGTDTGPAAAREALVRITSLYLAALSLPESWSEELESERSARAAEKAEWKAIYPSIGSRLPFQYYGAVFNPLPVPPEASIVGDLADDIADIFGDVEAGLQLYDAGQLAEARWQWSFQFIHHWGEHATSAIRALHCYLAAECPDRLPRPS